MRESVGGLMDEAIAPETFERISEIISTEAKGAIEAHDLRTRHAGSYDVH
jgi:divalent metal cation (Fe/Co/Zn/Cd) transporter